MWIKRKLTLPLKYALLLPAFIVIFVTALYPLLSTFYLSLKSYFLKTPWLNKGFIFLSNYIKAFTTPRFWNSLLNTFYFTFTSIFLELILGLGIALLLHRYIFAKAAVRASIILPWAVPTVVAAQMWRWMWHDKFGIINYILKILHIIPHYETWLGSPITAMPAIIIADVWKTTPFMVLLLLAGLVSIPEDLYQAARVDGANCWQRFKRITLPLLKPAIFVSLLFRTIDAFRVFDMVYVLTKGGPGNSTEVLSLYAYKTLFSSMNFGYGSTLCVITFLCVVVITIIYTKIFKVKID